MILRKVAYFKCDWCRAEDQGEIEELGHDTSKPSLGIYLPEGWVGSSYHETFCSSLCESELALKRAQERLKLALEAAR